MLVTGSTSLRVIWRQPPQGKGRIRYFAVEWFKASEDGNIQGSRQKKVVSLDNKMADDRYTTDITNLEPNTYYKVMVKAVTRKGSGDPATHPVVKTKGEGEIENVVT